MLQPNSPPPFLLLIDASSNMFLNHIGRPSLYLPACMVLWGAISCVTGQRLTFCLLAHFPTLVRRRHPQLYRSAPHSILPWLRGGRLFPWRPLSSIEVVQALGTWAPHRTTGVWQSHQQCLWFAHRLKYPEWDAGEDGPRSLEVSRCRASCLRIILS